MGVLMVRARLDLPRVAVSIRVTSAEATGMLAAAAFVRIRGNKMTGFFPGFALTRGTKLVVPAMVTVVVPPDVVTLMDASFAVILGTRVLPFPASIKLNTAMGK